MNVGILKEGDKVQTNGLYVEAFNKFFEGTVTGVVPDEDGELIFVDYRGFDVYWLKLMEDKPQ